MRIEVLKLQNYKLFDDQNIEFAYKEKNKSNFTVFIGNNGAGKTSVLAGIVNILSGLIARTISEKGKGTPIKVTDIKNGKNFASITATLSDYHKERSQEFCWTIAKTRPGRNTEVRSNLEQLNEVTQKLRQSFTLDENISLPLIAYYPAERTVIDIPIRTKKGHLFEQINGYDNSLDGVNFRTFFEWFRDRQENENIDRIKNEKHRYQEFLDKIKNDDDKKLNQSKLESFLSKNTYEDRQLKSVRDSIYKFIPSFSNLRIDKKPRLGMFVDKALSAGESVELNIEQLSQGERCLLALVGDIARRLAIMNPSLENTNEGRGIVLIDKIDLHLHPQWQRSILRNLEETFPNIQFIITTHSPSLISDQPNALVYPIEDAKIQDPIYPFGSDVNQVLSRFMSTHVRNKEVQNLIDGIENAFDCDNLEEMKENYYRLKELLPLDHIDLANAEILFDKDDEIFKE